MRHNLTYAVVPVAPPVCLPTGGDLADGSTRVRLTAPETDRDHPHPSKSPAASADEFVQVRGRRPGVRPRCGHSRSIRTPAHPVDGTDGSHGIAANRCYRM